MLSIFNELYMAFNKAVNINYKLKGYDEITINIYQYLVAIYSRGKVTVTELSYLLGLKKASITQMTENLTDKGYVQKIRSEEDKRSSFLSLTNTGLQLMNSEDIVYNDIIQRINESLSDSELEYLERLLIKLLKIIKEMDAL